MVLAAVSGGIVYYYNPNFFRRLYRDQFEPRIPQAASDAVQASKKVRREKFKRQVSEEQTKSTSGGLQKRNISGPVNNTVKAETAKGDKVVLPRVEDDDNTNDAEWAKRLKEAQSGTKLQTATQQNAPKKSRRITKGQEWKEDFDSAETSSNGGRDAEGEPAAIVETSPSSVSRGGDVTDMLEKSGPGISALRLTNTEEKKKATKPKAAEEVLTKKQRQRQKQNDERRELREAADKQHEEKKLKQIHGARTAEGTSKQMKASTFTQNVWQNKQPQEQQAPEQSAQQPLLDTFDNSMEENKPAVSARPLEDVTNGAKSSVNQIKEELGEEKTQALAASERERPTMIHKESWADQVDADEQEQWAKKLQDEADWEVATKKKGRRKNKKDTENSSEASQPLNGNNTSAPAVKAPTNGAQSTVKTKNPYHQLASEDTDQWGAV